MPKRPMKTALVPVLPAAPPSHRLSFGRMSLVDIDGVLYVPVDSDERAHVMRRADNPDLLETFTHERLRKFQDADKLVERAGALSTCSALLAANRPCDRLSDLPDARLDVVLFRKSICDGILRLIEHGEASLSDESLKIAIPKVWLTYAEEERRKVSPDGRCGKATKLRNAPAPTTVRRWLKIYREGAFDPMALCPHYGHSGNRLPRFGAEEQMLLHRFAARYANLRKPKKIGLWRDMNAIVDRLNRMRSHAGLRPLVCPGRMALAAAINRLDQLFVFAGREGASAAQRKFAITNRGLEVQRPLQRVEIDEWRIPLQVILSKAGLWRELNQKKRDAIEKARLWLTTVIDVRTKIVLAMRLSRTCTAANAIATLQMAVSDKTGFAQAAGCQHPWDQCGTMETVAADAGAALRAKETKATVADLGAEYLNPQAGNPKMRGTQERLYKTVHDAFITFFDGRSFKDVVEKGDYDSQGNAVLDVETLAKLLVRFIVDIYHNTPHRGLGGQTPRNAWNELRKRYGVKPPPSKADAAAIFGTTISRRITNTGVAVVGLRFQSVPLQRIRAGRIRYDVEVRIDPSDLGHVWAFDGSVWHRIPCMRQGMQGVSLEQWLLAVATTRRRYADEAAESEPVVLEALRDVRAAAEGARRRAGIASPVLSGDDYKRIERKFFSGFDREDADGIDITAERPLPTDPKIIEHAPVPPRPRSRKPARPAIEAHDAASIDADAEAIDGVDPDLFVLERDVEPEPETETEDDLFEARFKLED